MRPHKLQTVSTGNSRRFFFAIGGWPLGSKGEGCHACPGLMGLVTLSKDGTNFSVVARNSLYELQGSWGKIPAEEGFSLQKIGPENTYGWVISSCYTGQGITLYYASIHAPLSDRFRDLGQISLGYDDSGTCFEDNQNTNATKCSSYEYQISFLPQKNTPFYPILMESTGSRQGAPFNQTYRMNFDAKTMKYIQPANLPDSEH